MEGAEITIERLEFVSRAIERGQTRNQVFAAHIDSPPREDLIPYVADFLLQLEDVKWSIISGVVNDTVVISVRNLGYSRNAGGFVKACFADVGNAGGHRAMAKAVVPVAAFRDKFGSLDSECMSQLLSDLAAEFLGEPAAAQPTSAPVGRAVTRRGAVSREKRPRRPLVKPRQTR